MLRAVALAGTVAASAFLLGLPVLVVEAGHASDSCLMGEERSVDAAVVVRQVRKVLDGEKPVRVPGLDRPGEQIGNARVIEAVGVGLGVPVRGRVVALAAALGESRLRNLPSGDRDSSGLFQQRPSQGWGSADRIRDPRRASAMFYERLLRVPGWQSLTVGQAAQAVQESARPRVYARWEPLAWALERALRAEQSKGAGRVIGAAAPAGRPQCAGTSVREASFGAVPAGALPRDYRIPAGVPRKVRTAVRWALAQLGTPYQWGGRCTDPRGPDPMGRCDCSSLVQAAYRAAGVWLPRTTYQQVSSGKAVPLTALEPGDLVFTEGTAAAPAHVGMVIGSGLIINAPRTGDVVRVASVASWRPRILAARRVV